MSMYLTSVTEQEVKNELLLLSPNKVPGFDNVPSKILKSSPENSVAPVIHIYNMSFANAIVPEKLKIAKVIPI